MKTRKLMAIRAHKYGTRHLTAGEEYEAPIPHAFALVAGKKARFVSDKPVRATEKPLAEPMAAPPPESEPEPETATTESTIDRLRLEATRLGINVDGRWGVARLQHEIRQARR